MYYAVLLMDSWFSKIYALQENVVPRVFPLTQMRLALGLKELSSNATYSSDTGSTLENAKN